MTDAARPSGTAPRQLVLQGAKFVLAGSTATAGTFAVYWTLRTVLAPVVATLLANAVTTVAGTELHRRFTFSRASAVPARKAVQNLASWAWSSGATSAGLLVLPLIVPRPGVLPETLAILVLSAVGGAGRFAALRWWVLRPPEAGRTRASPVR
ncbi:GtrA family protein [Amycolatopsis sp., V23-08]|uniref:GtrA family protein n=1 Tax=Amycolatopsis heterodermiae TaxID=3110235 RepID=A0ABU5RIE6_9PSEU|nr:GtrA family protein [Amycolatopsis sp., V23-08]MEA5365364.1 GtrA family protein [Amycolatopsis sp., V23-08]